MTNHVQTMSYIELLSEDPFDAREIAAAELLEEVADRLQEAFQSSSQTLTSLADALSVSAERVQEVISGEADILVSTLGRYLKAMGEELSLSFKRHEEQSHVDGHIDVYAESGDNLIKFTLEHKVAGAPTNAKTYIGVLDSRMARLAVVPGAQERTDHLLSWSGYARA